MSMLSQDAMRCLSALIGEIEGVGSTQLKTPWMKQGWHRRLTWLRWLRELRAYVENLHTIGMADHLARQRNDTLIANLAAENTRLRAQLETQALEAAAFVERVARAVSGEQEVEH
jgi:hypothetical protein